MGYPKGLKRNVARDAQMKALRERGWTWDRIGKRYGLTRQAASQAVKRMHK